MTAAPPDSGRLASLDAFRGFAIASMVLVNNPGDWNHAYAPLLHAPWNGWTFTDLVFPFFLFIAGVSLSLSLQRRGMEGSPRAALLATMVRRAGVIFAVGFALNLFPAFDWATVRIPGVLQRIALCVLVAAPVVIWGGTRTVMAAIVALFAAYTVPMLLVPVPDASGVLAAGALEPGRDFGAWVDRQVFGPHLWAKSRTWDPEGLVSTLPAAASLLFGALAGRWLQAGRAPLATTGGLFTAGLLALAAGSLLDAVFMPINKNLWTPSYCVFMTGGSLIAFALFHGALDAIAPIKAAARALARPLTIYGMNALFLFALSGFIGRLLGHLRVGDGSAPVSLKAWLYAPFPALGLSPENASLAWAVAFNGAMLAVAWGMWRMRWFVKA